MSDRLLLGGIEAGGTKFLCAVADPDGAVLLETRIATTTPAETLGAASAFFRDAQRAHGDLSALSIGSFGPLSLNPNCLPERLGGAKSSRPALPRGDPIAAVQAAPPAPQTPPFIQVLNQVCRLRPLQVQKPKIWGKDAVPMPPINNQLGA